MSWYDTQDNQNVHILWSKVRYTRNLAELRFGFSGNGQAHEKFSQRLAEIMSRNGFHEEHIQKGFSPEVCALAEKQFIDRSFAASGFDRALYFNEPCSLTIYSGGDFHINIQALLSGAVLYEAYKIASEAEELLDGEFEFAYSDSLGYLASDISRCGSGMELSCALFLPTARHGARLGELMREAIAYGALLEPFLAKYDNAGDIYILSYVPERTIDEKKAILDFSNLVNRLVESESVSERIIFSNKSTIICDKAWRALGALSSARSVDEEELLSLLSRIRLSLSLEATKDDAPPLSLSLLSSLLANGLTGSVIAAEGGACRSSDDCRVARAIAVKRRLLPFSAEIIKAAI